MSAFTTEKNTIVVRARRDPSALGLKFSSEGTIAVQNGRITYRTFANETLLDASVADVTIRKAIWTDLVTITHSDETFKFTISGTTSSEDAANVGLAALGAGSYVSSGTAWQLLKIVKAWQKHLGSQAK